jgi:LPXTG-motif cell wall-anchored protein
VVALICLGVSGGAAFAGIEEYPPEPTVGSLVVTGPTGGVVNVSGQGCGMSETVAVTFNGAQVASLTTDPNGAFSGSFTVPAGTNPGTYPVVATNEICVLSNTVTIPAPAVRALAFTGSSGTISLAWVGAAVVALGALLVFVARRRAPATTRH